MHIEKLLLDVMPGFEQKAVIKANYKKYFFADFFSAGFWQKLQTYAENRRLLIESKMLPGKWGLGCWMTHWIYIVLVRHFLTYGCIL